MPLRELSQVSQSTEDSVADNTAMSPLTELESKMPYMGLNLADLTVQEEKFVLLATSGMSLAAAGRAVGLQHRQHAFKMSKKPAVAKALEYYRGEMREKLNFTRENAHKMYMEAYQGSANATEMVKATDSLVKLHALITPEPVNQVNINLSSEKVLNAMSDEELLAVMGKDSSHFIPQHVSSGEELEE